MVFWYSWFNDYRWNYGSVLTANSLANQAILDSGMALTIENGGRIVTQQFLDQFIKRNRCWNDHWVSYLYDLLC